MSAPYNPSPLVYGGQLYVLLDRGFLAAYDAATGREIYAKHRIDVGTAAFTASPWASDGKIFCLTESGTTCVIAAGPKFELLGTNELEDSALATPAIVGDRLLIRTAGKLWCIRSTQKQGFEDSVMKLPFSSSSN